MKSSARTQAAANQERQRSCTYAANDMCTQVLEWEIAEMHQRSAAIQAQGKVVPFAFGSRLQVRAQA